MTLNGLVLHNYVLPLMLKAGSLIKLAISKRMIAIFAGALSGVSWFYAAMLGIGKPLNWKYSLVEILAAYPVLIVGGFASMLLLTAWSKRKASVKNTRVVATSTKFDARQWNIDGIQLLTEWRSLSR